MDTRPWKRERIIELPRSQRSTEPLPLITHGVYCGACGGPFTAKDVFCGLCGTLLQKEEAVNEYATRLSGLTGASWQ
jgi:hypothetical protein